MCVNSFNIISLVGGGLYYGFFVFVFLFVECFVLEISVIYVDSGYACLKLLIIELMKSV